MERYGLITLDRRLKDELNRLIRELDSNIVCDDLHMQLETYRAHQKQLEKAPPGSFDAAVPPLLNTVIFFDAALDPPYRLPESLGQYKSALETAGFANSESIWIALGPASLASQPHHSHVNGALDLIVTPLDRTVALQKLEYLRAKDQAVSPSYLFQAKVEHDLELGKLSKVTHLTETSCTVLSPRPLLPGVAGTLISTAFGEGSLSRVEVRSVDSVPAFLESPLGTEKRYEVTLRFLGLKLKQLQSIRHTLGPEHSQKKSPAIEQLKARPKNDFRVALLSPSPSLRALLEASLEDLTNPVVTTTSGLKEFEWLLRKAKAANAAPSSVANEPLQSTSGILWHKSFVGPKRAEDQAPPLHANEVTISYQPTEQIVAAVSPALQDGQTLLRAPAEQWQRDANPLLKPLLAADRDILQEALHYLEAAENAKEASEHSFLFDVSASCKEQIHVKIKRKEKATPTRGPIFDLVLMEQDHHDAITTAGADASAASGSSASNKSNAKKSAELPLQQLPPKAGPTGFEAILIDANLLRFDLAEKLKSLTEWLTSYNITNVFGNRPPIIIVNASDANFDPLSLRGTPVSAVAFDYVDRRYHRSLFLSLSRPELWNGVQTELQNVSTDIKAALVRPSRFAMISEVSITVIDSSPFKVGTELMLFSTSFPSAQDGIWGRVRTITQQGEGEFANEFIFFGVTDQTQREIRRLIADDYAKKKAQGES